MTQILSKQKRLWIAVALAFVSVCSAMAQSEQLIKANDKVMALEKDYVAAYDQKDYNSTEKILTREAAVLEGLTLSADEQEKYGGNVRAMLNNVYYNLACTYSLLNKKPKAVEALRKSIGYGFNNYRHATLDTDFNNVRGYKPFKRLMDGIKQYDKLEILKAAAPYAMENTDSLPQFTYLPSTNGNLKSLRQYLKLDSVAGNGDETSRILRLMYFVHDNVQHDGGNSPTCERDAIDIYNYAKATGRGVNCRNLAIMLCEAYLSMGIPARYITCLPKDTADQDCHVICSVWSKERQKWLWIDPTFAAYVMDENDNMLGIAEVRQRLIEGLPLKLNDDANWNHRNKETKEQYLDYYMAKNLYWLECPVKSTFNAESPYRRTGSKYVGLLPKGFSSSATNSNYFTSNPDYFWQSPE